MQVASHNTSMNAAQGQLRPIAEQDNAAMAAIIRSVLTELGCTGPGIAIHDPEVDALYETYGRARSAYFVVEHDGVIAGGGGVAPLKGGDKDTCELQKWYILPRYRDYGYGRMLFEKMMEAGRLAGFKRCYVETFDHMVAAGKFYTQAGFLAIEGPMGATGHFACNRWYIKEL